MPESGVENLVFHLKHHNLGTPKNCSIFGKPLDLCMILIILLIYFLTILPYIFRISSDGRRTEKNN